MSKHLVMRLLLEGKKKDLFYFMNHLQKNFKAAFFKVIVELALLHIVLFSE